MKNIIRWSFILLFACACLAACGDVQRMAPILDIDALKARGEFPSFYYWRKDRGSAAFEPFLFVINGKRETGGRFDGKPAFKNEDASKGIFWPEARYSSGKLEESVEVPSPDGKWGIKTYGIKTYADDLNNVFLNVSDREKGRAVKVKVPANSMGTVWPLFWNPDGRRFYFMVMMGDAASRTFGLWQYDVPAHRLSNIGETDGRAFLSPDGEWVLWETGLLMDESRSPTGGRCIHIMAYHIPEDVNYRVLSGDTLNLFHGWKK